MTHDITVTDALYARYETLATELDGFDSADDLIEYVLSASATELEQTTDTETTDEVDDEAVHDRLKQLGYVE